MTNNSNTLRSAQLKMLDALIEIDRICKIHNIDYWLDAGTLLGAVRHKGFIPWDDDIDICMTRADFNRFLKLAPQTMDISRFFLQTPQTDPNYIGVNIPCKFRINNTFILESHEIDFDCFQENSHHGIFVDIFPYDKYSKKTILKKLERMLSIGFRLNVLARFKNLPFHKKILSRIFFPFTRLPLLNWLKKHQTAYMENKKESYVLGAGCETPFSRAYFEPSEIFPTSTILFENYEFKAPHKTHRYLIKMFGNNYMELPPIEQRRQHGIIN